MSTAAAHSPQRPTPLVGGACLILVIVQELSGLLQKYYKREKLMRSLKTVQGEVHPFCVMMMQGTLLIVLIVRWSVPLLSLTTTPQQI